MGKRAVLVADGVVMERWPSRRGVARIEVDLAGRKGKSYPREVYDAAEDLLCLEAHRRHARARRQIRYEGAGTYMDFCCVEADADELERAVLALFAHEDVEPALALAQRWADGFPRDNPWAFDLRAELLIAVLERPGLVSALSFWREHKDSGLRRGATLEDVRSTVRRQAFLGMVNYSHEVSDKHSALYPTQRLLDAGKPARNPLGLRSFGLIWR